MNKKESLFNILTIFDKINPNPRTELMYKDEYQLTVAVILSAQCTDKRVNIITKIFLRNFQTLKLCHQQLLMKYLN